MAKRNVIAVLMQAMELGPSSDDYATLLANRSLCLLRLENGPMALKDATLCRMMRPNWPKACYRQGAAFMRLKVKKQESSYSILYDHGIHRCCLLIGLRKSM